MIKFILLLLNIKLIHQ